jgi:hypothetical protein
MGNSDWKTEVRNHFENIRILAKCQAETITHFEQFCEFIAESAFEALGDELLNFGVKVRTLKAKGRDIRLSICFPGSKDEQFQYKIVLPKNSVELRLRLIIKARKTPGSNFVTKDEEFMPGLPSAEVMKLPREDVILDILEHYRNFSYEALTSPD